VLNVMLITLDKLRPLLSTSFPVNLHLSRAITLFGSERVKTQTWCDVLVFQGMPEVPWGGRCWGKSRGCNGLGIPLESPRVPAAAPSATAPHPSHGRCVVLCVHVVCRVLCQYSIRSNKSGISLMHSIYCMWNGYSRLWLIVY
jgi:hypothetical protein